jgi:hypothetical protein
MPNPFRGSTVIRFDLPTAQQVSLAVYDAAGREVARPIRNEVLGAGQHRVVFEARGLPSGIYLCRLRAGAWTDTRTMAHLR